MTKEDIIKEECLKTPYLSTTNMENLVERLKEKLGTSNVRCDNELNTPETIYNRQVVVEIDNIKYVVG